MASNHLLMRPSTVATLAYAWGLISPLSGSLTPAQQAELDALAALPEDQINTRAIPEQRDWSGARRGVSFRPVKNS